mgnify:CR=1 FL=1
MPQKGNHFSFKVLTINIHKGFTSFNRRFILPELRDAVRATGADIVFLQEILGKHIIHPLHAESWPDQAHYEFLADTMWNDYAYGRNAVYPEGHHGNAVLSRFAVCGWLNRDISQGRAEKRGILCCRVNLSDASVILHVICVHLGLRETHRQAQLAIICEMINNLPKGAPVVVAGDFNDWRVCANKTLAQKAGLNEVFSHEAGLPARTFPARFPLLRLDRIYVRHARFNAPHILSVRPWSHLSDHAPLAVEIIL